MTKPPLIEPPENGEKRVFLKDRAYDKLKALILSEHFPQGSFLSERSLAEKLRMSKTPVRSAIERLEAEGFVSVSPQQGIVVKALSLKELTDHFDLRIAIESFVVKRLAGRLTSEQIAALQEKLSEQEAIINERDIARAVESDLSFHLLFCEFFDNQEILRTIWLQHDMLYRVVNRLYHYDDFRKRMEQNHLEHVNLVKLMLEGDGERAAKYVEKHIEFSKRVLLLH